MAQAKKQRRASAVAASKGAIPARAKRGESKGAAVKRVQKRHPGKKIVLY